MSMSVPELLRSISPAFVLYTAIFSACVGVGFVMGWKTRSKW